jgi:peptidyl-prolyl cis-trans isomerase B (cyclophilin B)
MNTRSIFCLYSIALAFGVGCKEEASKPAPSTSVASEKSYVPPPITTTNDVAVIKTGAGEIVVEFWPEVAPVTVENFKKLARQGFYDGTASHRLMQGFMIQMGDPLTKDPAAADRWGTGGPGYTIPAEFSERRHERGVLSMARGSDPNSAGSQFFICFGPAPGLDRQYTTFGKMIRGEDVLAKLETTPCGPGNAGEASRPTQRVGVESIRILPGNQVK